MTQTVAVVGAGITGLTAACDLLASGCGVTLFESAPYAGGLAFDIPCGAGRVEAFYRHIFTSDTHIRDLAAELGLADAIRWFAPDNAVALPGASGNATNLYPFTTPGDLLRFSPLSLPGRIRLGLSVLGAKRVRDWRALEGETAREWVLRTAGRDVWRTVWEPLMRSKFDDDADSVSAVWLWNKLALRGHTRSSGMKSELLGYMDGGFGRLVDALTERIRTLGGRIETGTAVERIDADPETGAPSLTVSSPATEPQTLRFDRALWTAAPALLADAAPSLPSESLEKLRCVRYKGNICALLELSRPLTPHYWISVADPDIPFVALIEHTNLVGAEAYGRHIVYLSRYIDAADPLFSAPDDEILRRFKAVLPRFAPDFDATAILAARVTRARYAQPVIPCGYSGRIPPFDPVPGKAVFLASMPQIYPEDRGMNYAVRLGREAARKILSPEAIR